MWPARPAVAPLPVGAGGIPRHTLPALLRRRVRPLAPAPLTDRTPRNDDEDDTAGER